MAMRDRWQLPEEAKFRYTGSDWLLLLLDQCTAEERDLTKLLLWKTWAIHSNITHQSGPTGISEAVHAPCALQTSLSEVCTSETNGSGKGKKPCSSSGNTRSPEAKSVWEPPPLGWVRFNVDGFLVSQSGVGVVARDSDGRVVLTAWRALFRCLDVVEAEA
jgi:hypothetical protein